MDISLALGGGGSRGPAHIGVIRQLEQEGFRIRAVAGSSAGGIVAAVYAAGYTLDEMEAMFSEVDQSKLFGRTSRDGPALLGLSGAAKVLEKFLGQRTFNDLKIPCAVTAVDLKSSREVVINQGRLVDAVLATIALPGIFPPKQFNQYQLVDGAVLDPVPVSVARLLAPSLPVVAVVLSPLTMPVEPEEEHRMSHLPLPIPVPAPIIERITRLRVAQAFEIFLHAVDTGARLITELRLQIDEPDVIIRPDVGAVGLLDRVDVHKIIKQGEKAVIEVLPELISTAAWPNRLRRRIFPHRNKHPKSRMLANQP